MVNKVHIDIHYARVVISQSIKTVEDECEE